MPLGCGRYCRRQRRRRSQMVHAERASGAKSGGGYAGRDRQGLPKSWQRSVTGALLRFLQQHYVGLRVAAEDAEVLSVRRPVERGDLLGRKVSDLVTG